jgi:hypothetical protein
MVGMNIETMQRFRSVKLLGQRHFEKEVELGG